MKNQPGQIERGQVITADWLNRIGAAAGRYESEGFGRKQRIITGGFAADLSTPGHFQGVALTVYDVVPDSYSDNSQGNDPSLFNATLCQWDGSQSAWIPDPASGIILRTLDGLPIPAGSLVAAFYSGRDDRWVPCGRDETALLYVTSPVLSAKGFYPARMVAYDNLNHVLLLGGAAWLLPLDAPSPLVPLVNTSSAGGVGTGPQTVTPGSMSGITVGTLLLIDVVGSNVQELVVVTGTTGTTFTAAFASAHGGGFAILACYPVEGRLVGEGDSAPRFAASSRLAGNLSGGAGGGVGRVATPITALSGFTPGVGTVVFYTRVAGFLTAVTAPQTVYSTDCWTYPANVWVKVIPDSFSADLYVSGSYPELFPLLSNVTCDPITGLNVTFINCDGTTFHP